jgi:chromosome segregation ATPase
MTTKRKATAIDPIVRSAELRSELAQIEANAKKRRKTELTQQLVSIRAELKAARKTYAVLEKKVLEGQAKLNGIESEMMRTLDARGRLQSIRPEIADFLPADETVKEWEENCHALDAHMEKLRAAKSALGNIQIVRVEAVSTNDRINTLLWQEQNVLNLLRGSLAQSPVGGTFAPL